MHKGRKTRSTLFTPPQRSGSDYRDFLIENAGNSSRECSILSENSEDSDRHGNKRVLSNDIEL
ncbi:hypothetical protein [Prevotella melaninogenica]